MSDFRNRWQSMLLIPAGLIAIAVPFTLRAQQASKLLPTAPQPALNAIVQTTQPNQSSAQRARKPLTNADVVSMLAQGKQERAILDTIRNHPATFDVSNQARAAFDRQCAAIKKPVGVSTGVWATEIGDVWNAMKNVVICQETNGRGGEGACDLNPLPSSPKNTSATKAPGRTEYEAVTLERGVTHDPGFANWANPAQQGQKPVISMTPTRTNPQRDAAPSADAATKAQTKAKLDAQLAAFKRATPTVRVPTKTAEASIPEMQRLNRQKMFVASLRKQAGIRPLKTGSGQLGANSKTMAATQTSQTNNQTTIGSAPVPMRIRPAGSLSTGGGTLLLGGGTNQGGSKTAAPPQTIPPAGSPSTGGGTLLLGGGTNQGNSRTVAPPQTITLAGAPEMRPAPTSVAQHPTAPNSPISATNALPKLKIAAGSVGGYVLWDTSTIHYQLGSPCQGFNVTISTTSNGGLQTLASTTNFTTPFGPQPVWNFSGQGSQGPWLVCGYAFFKLPEGVPLEVDAAITQPSAFASPLTLEPLQKNQFEISGGNCGSTPQSTLAVVLNSGSILCGDYAFNVNFAGLNPRLNAAMANTKICFGAQIYTVNGVNSTENANNPVVFTQDPAYNDYVITGCNFGNTEGGQVYLSGAVTGGRINMTVFLWTPTMIEAEVQPGLTGVLDGWPDLIVVPPGGGAPAKFANCRFYAQRQSVLLSNIPQQYARLATEQVGDGTHGFGTMYCAGPYPGLGAGRDLFPCVAFNYGEPLDGVTNNPSQRGQTSIAVSNAVDRDGGPLQFTPGEDVYDLGNLAPGFAIDYFGVHWYTWSQSACDDFRINEMKAGDTVNWSYQGRLDQYFQKGSQIIVDWPVDYCTSNWIGLFRDFSYYNSGYSLEVHVKGPIGVDPWTGQPTSGN